MTQNLADIANQYQRKITIRITDNKREVVVEFTLADNTISSLKFTVDELTTFIRKLGAVRQQMVVGKPTQSLEGVEIQTVSNTIWHIQPDIRNEGSALAFYHPAYGPIGMVFNREDIPNIIRLLTTHLRIQTSAEGKSN